MSTVNIFNSMKTPVRLKVFTQITDDYSQGDEVKGHKRFVVTTPTAAPTDYTLAPNTAIFVRCSKFSGSRPGPCVISYGTPVCLQGPLGNAT
jgi:hypothetical protein